MRYLGMHTSNTDNIAKGNESTTPPDALSASSPSSKIRPDEGDDDDDETGRMTTNTPPLSVTSSSPGNLSPGSDNLRHGGTEIGTNRLLLNQTREHHSHQLYCAERLRIAAQT